LFTLPGVPKNLVRIDPKDWAPQDILNKGVGGEPDISFDEGKAVVYTFQNGSFYSLNIYGRDYYEPEYYISAEDVPKESQRVLNPKKWSDLMGEYAMYYSKGLRKGQSMMLALSNVDMELYKELTNTEADCFFDDEKIGAFMLRIL
jgi:hypothetical protein